MTKMVDDFNATNPEYTITNVPLAAGDIYTKVPLASQSGEEIPDFGVIHYYMISNWIDQGILVPMNEVIAEHPGNQSGKLPAGCLGIWGERRKEICPSVGYAWSNRIL